MSLNTLLGHLALFSSFTAQGEVLCTQGFAYLLREPRARQAFGEFLFERAGVRLGADVRWVAEATQADGTRPDLEARAPDDRVVAKIEAKLGAQLEESQLQSYADDLATAEHDTVLGVLVQPARVSEVVSVVGRAFRVEGSGPTWRLSARRITVHVFSWPDAFGTLDRASVWPKGGDLDQLSGLYSALTTGDVMPLSPIEDRVAWRQQEREYHALADFVGRKLAESAGERLSPLLPEPSKQGQGADAGYLKRYFGAPFFVDGNEHPERPAYSVGVRPPFEGFVTPLWIRFHHQTPCFSLVRQRLHQSAFKSEGRLVESEGHVWLPIDVEPGSDVGATVEDVLAKIEQVRNVAYGAN